MDSLVRSPHRGGSQEPPHLFPAKQQPILFDILIVMSQTFLLEFGIVLMVAAALGIVARLLKQPLVLAYLVAGVIIGPFALGLVKDYFVIESFASIGIIFLLFLIGLELNPKKLFEIGGSALTVGIGQILISGTIYYLVATKFGLTGIGAIYLAIALTFSSTAIIVTLLSNRHDLDSLHGKILVGILLIQDFVAVILLTIASGIRSSDGQSSLFLQLGVQIVVKATVLFVLIYLVGKYVLPPIMNRIARSQELLFLSSLAWCFSLAIVASALGFSAEIGAFLAGISLAPLPFSSHVASKTKPLRDFFITIFFIYLGTTLVFSDIKQVITPAIIYSLLILLLNPLIIIVFMGALGYRKRTSFMTGITLTQVSEFTFIVVALGNKLDILPKQVGTLASVVAIITVFISTYLISNAGKIYHFLHPYLGFIESGKKRDVLLNLPEELEHHVIMIGYHRIGTILLEYFNTQKEKVAVVDVDPKRVQILISAGENCIYGDAMDRDIAEHVNLAQARMVISTLDKFEENEMILYTYRKINSHLKFIMVASGTDEALDLYRLGADLVIIPTMISGDYLVHLLKETDDGSKGLEKFKEREMKKIGEHSDQNI